MSPKSVPFAALAAGDKRALERALDSGSDVDTEAGMYTLLAKAVELRNVELARSLISRGANVELHAPLLAAAALHDLEMMALLLAAGASVHARDGKGHTALHRARSWRAADLLLEHGADVNARSQAGYTPLMRAQKCSVARHLITRGADLEARNAKGLTTLMVFALSGCADLAALLLEHGANLQLTAPDGATAFMLAVEEGHDDVVSVLREAGAGPQPAAHLYSAVAMRRHTTPTTASGPYR